MNLADAKSRFTEADLADLLDRLAGPRHEPTGRWPCPTGQHAEDGGSGNATSIYKGRSWPRAKCHKCGETWDAISLLELGGLDTLGAVAEVVAMAGCRAPTAPGAPPKSGESAKTAQEEWAASLVPTADLDGEMETVAAERQWPTWYLREAGAVVARRYRKSGSRWVARRVVRVPMRAADGEVLSWCDWFGPDARIAEGAKRKFRPGRNPGLWGMDQATERHDADPARPLWVFEGLPDWIAANAALYPDPVLGATSADPPLGLWAVADWEALPDEVIVVQHNDAAGAALARRIAEALPDAKQVLPMLLPNGEDFDDMRRRLGADNAAAAVRRVASG